MRQYRPARRPSTFTRQGCSSIEKPRRRYELKRRAASRDETRRRIVEAAVALHETLGPAHTSLSAVAERAGVQRATLYRHFPDENALLRACSGHHLAQHPPPDPAAWRLVPDPEARLRHGLGEAYAHYRRTEAMTALALRDAPLKPVLQEVAGPVLAHLRSLADALAEPWGATASDRRLRAALGHALDFTTWRSLARHQCLTDDEVIELMLGLVRAAANAP